MRCLTTDMPRKGPQAPKELGTPIACGSDMKQPSFDHMAPEANKLHRCIIAEIRNEEPQRICKDRGLECLNAVEYCTVWVKDGR